MVIFFEYYIIYKLNYVPAILSPVHESSEVILAPFEVWKHFSHNILVSLVTSLFFPLVYLTATKCNPLKSKMIQFALLNFFIGLGGWILLAEEGYRKFDGNFGWQVIVAMYLLFFSLLIHFVNDCKSNKISKIKKYIVGGAFLLHFIWGLVYWAKIIIFMNYF